MESFDVSPGLTNPAQGRYIHMHTHCISSSGERENYPACFRGSEICYWDMGLWVRERAAQL